MYIYQGLDGPWCMKHGFVSGGYSDEHVGFNIVRVCNTNSKSMVLAVMTVYTRALLGPKGFVSSGN